MKLSEAIRLGSLLRPQIRGAFHSDLGSCALGAAGEAAGCDRDLTSYDFHEHLVALWEPTLTTMVVHPVTHSPVSVMGAIASLNDGRTETGIYQPWSREQIADWVATVEQEIDRECAANTQAPAEVLQPA